MLYRIMIRLLSVTCILLIGCGSTFYFPTEKDAAEHEISLEALVNGRQLYIGKCGNCHNIYPPDKFNKHEWQQVLDKMQERAKVNDTEKTAILNYLDIYAK